MNADGTDIHQISFNQSHDLDPAVLDNGRIVFSRWDHAGAAQRDQSVRRASRRQRARAAVRGEQPPDGHGRLGRFEFLDPRPIANGELHGARSTVQRRGLGGDLLTIDTRTIVENTQPNAREQRRARARRRQPRRRTTCARFPDPRPAAATARRSRCATAPVACSSSWTQCRLLDGERDRALHRGAARGGHAAGRAAAVRHLDLRPARRDAAAGRDPHRRHAIYTDVVALQALTLPPVLHRSRRRASTSTPSSRPKASASSTSAASTTSTASTSRPPASRRSPIRR